MVRRPIEGCTAGRRGEAGYNFVALLIAITLLNIALAAVLPMLANQVQREKEEELIARGLQYAEAIRVFKGRFGRPPVRLEELVEARPRSIRQLWKDPMTDGGNWQIIPAGIGGNSRPGGGRNPNQPPGRGRRGQEGGFGTPQLGERPQGAPGAQGRDQDRFGLPGDGEQVSTGPIGGVRSTSTEKAIKVFFDGQRHSDWGFTDQILLAGTGVPGTEAGANLSLTPGRWIGRPFLVSPDQLAGGPGGLRPGGGPGENRGPNGRPGFGTPGGDRPGFGTPGGNRPGFGQPVQRPGSGAGGSRPVGFENRKPVIGGGRGGG